MERFRLVNDIITTGNKTSQNHNSYIVELRRLCFDLYIVSICVSNFFQFNCSSQTRGHPYKLYKPCGYSCIRALFFSDCVVKWLNSLPVDHVDFFSSFKRTVDHIDCFCCITVNDNNFLIVFYSVSGLLSVSLCDIVTCLSGLRGLSTYHIVRDLIFLVFRHLNVDALLTI